MSKFCPLRVLRPYLDCACQDNCEWHIPGKGCAIRVQAEAMLRDERIRYKSCQRNCGNNPEKCVGCFNREHWVPMKGNEPVKRCLP